MRIEIFDVDHGFCALATGDDGTRVLFDCGYNNVTGFRPSRLLAGMGVQVLDALIVSHVDEDHVSDLPNLQDRVRIRSIITNDSLNASALRHIKGQSGDIGPGAEALIRHKGRFMTTLRGGDSLPVMSGVELRLFWNLFPVFSDLNNLSLVGFLHYGGIHVIFPGDLEQAGWRALLQIPAFRAELRRVNVFVASHHGRENGFCEEVFRYCRPEIVIISDGPIVHASQKMTARYANQASGVAFGSRVRRVLTTRNDGHVCLYESIVERTGAWVTLNPPGFARGSSL